MGAFGRAVAALALGALLGTLGYAGWPGRPAAAPAAPEPPPAPFVPTLPARAVPAGPPASVAWVLVVRDERHRPLPDVPVTLTPLDAWPQGLTWTRWALRRRFDAPPAASGPSRTVRTDAHGRARFDGLRPRTRQRIEVDPGAPRGRLAWTRRVQDDRAVRELWLTAVRGRRAVAGRVLAPDGEPCRAWVTAWRAPATSGPFGFQRRWAQELGSVQADATGRFRLEALPAGEVYLDAVLPGVAELSGFPAEDDGEVVMSFPARDAGAALAGHVRDERGRPIGGALLCALVEERPLRSPPRSVRVFARSAPDGTFALRGLPAGRLADVEVEAAGCVMPRDPLPALELRAGVAEQVDLVLPRCGVVEGFVVDEAGRPLAGVAVGASLRELIMQATPGPDTRTDAQGRYRLEEASPYPLSVHATAPGFAGGSIDAAAPPPGGVVEAPPVVLVEGGSVRGQVHDVTGQPAAGVEVKSSYRMQIPNGTIAGDGPRTTTDPDGRFALQGLRRDAEWILIAFTAETQGDGVRIDVPAPGEDAADVPLLIHRASVLAGRVLEADGSPAHGVRLHGLARPGWPGAPAGTALDALGGFRINRLMAGPYTLQPRDMAGAPLGDPLEVTLGPGEVRDDIEIRLAPRVELAVDGVVVDAAGRPLRDVPLELTQRAPGGEERRHAGVSGADGRFRLVVGGPGPYELRAEGPEQGRIVEAPAEDVRIVVEARPPRALFGSVVAPGGVPVRIARIRPYPEANSKAGWLVDGEVRHGRFRLPLEDPTVAVRIEIEEARDALGRPLAVAPFWLGGLTPTSQPLTLCLAEGRTLRGRVTDPFGRGVPERRVVVTLRPEGGERLRIETMRTARTDAQGAFHLDCLPPVPLGLHVESDGSVWQPARIELPADAQDVRVKLVPRRASTQSATPQDAVTTRGVVVDEDGRPIAEAQVDVRGVCLLGQTWTDAEGRFVLITGRETRGTASSLLVEPPGHVFDRSPYLESGPVPFHFGDSEVRVMLRRGAWITGRVRDAAGPLRQALQVVARRVGSPHDTVQGRADPDTGVFRVGPLHETDYDLLVVKDVYAQVGTLRVRAPADGAELEVRERPRVHGRVLDAPERGVLVSASVGDTVYGEALGTGGTFGFHVDEGARCTVFVLDPDGGRYALLLDARPEDSPYVLRLEPGLAIAGRVADLPAGFDAEESWVDVSGLGVGITIPLRADGTFRIEGLPPGRYRVWPHAWHGPSIDPVEAVAGTEDLVLRPR